MKVIELAGETTSQSPSLDTRRRLGERLIAQLQADGIPESIAPTRKNCAGAESLWVRVGPYGVRVVSQYHIQTDEFLTRADALIGEQA